MEYEKCYVYQPDNGRPKKRRRIEHQGLQASWNIRRATYESAWRQQQHLVDAKTRQIDASTLSEITSFLDDQVQLGGQARIPTALVLTGASITSNASSIAQALSRNERSGPRRLTATLSTASAKNLKAALKALIQRATSVATPDDDEEDEHSAPPRKGRRLLNYDLQLLADYVKEAKTQQVLVAFEDTEAFDSDLLSELLELLGFWRDRIPFALLFNIATSVDFLQQRLSKEAVECLEGRIFDVTPASDRVEQVMETMVEGSTGLWIGPNLAGQLLERQHDYMQSTDSFIDAIRYAHMSHYYANALSIFLAKDLKLQNVATDHFEALRSLPSFRAYSASLLGRRELGTLQSLLDSDEVLLDFAKSEMGAAQIAMAGMIGALKIVRILQSGLPGTTPSALSTLYEQAMSGKLQGSALLRSLLLSIRKTPSQIAGQLLRLLSDNGGILSLTTQCEELAEELDSLLSKTASGQPLRSEHDLTKSTLRTTVVAQKVELSKQKSSLSKQDAAYTTILRRFTDMLEQLFTDKLIDPSKLVFHEIFMYDLKSPHREVFTPRPRHAVERALAAPHDYLDCGCCATAASESEEATLASSQPATAVLYQLYLESGSLINVNDLWQAFHAVIGDGKPEEGTMALFQRALAELRHLGMVKMTRKRVDHVAKVAWKGI